MRKKTNVNDIPEWDWDYEPLEEDEHLTHPELCKRIISDPIYFSKYELNFFPLELDIELYNERLQLLVNRGYPENMYPKSKSSQADFIRACCDPRYKYVFGCMGRRFGKTSGLTVPICYHAFTSYSMYMPPNLYHNRKPLVVWMEPWGQGYHSLQYNY